MAADDPRQLKAEGMGPFQKVVVWEVPGSVEGHLKELAWIHDRFAVILTRSLYALLPYNNNCPIGLTACLT